jgi:Phosphoenolpyruvate carboxykinase
MLTTTAVSRSLLLRHGRQTLQAASSSIGSRLPNCIHHNNNHDYHPHPHDSRPCFSPPHQRQQLSFQSTVAAVAPAVSGRDAYQVSETLVGPDACHKVGLDSAFGMVGPTTIYRNLTYAELFEHEVRNNEGNVVAAEYGDTFAVDTGKYTGRSPKDRWIVKSTRTGNVMASTATRR